MLHQIATNPGLNEHCKRVATFCDCVLDGRGFPLSERLLLRRAALGHHSRQAVDGNHNFQRLADDLGIVLNDRLVNCVPQLAPHLTTILEMADLFDSELEYGPYSGTSLMETLSSESLSSNNPAIGFILPFLRKIAPEQVKALVPKLPVFLHPASR